MTSEQKFTILRPPSLLILFDILKSLVPTERIDNIIYLIRGKKVILDRDLAMLYGVETKSFKRVVNRNSERFPTDFMFQLSKSELENWRCQIGTSNSAIKMGLRHRPYAFTEQGVAMLSGLLRSPQAIAVNIEIMRAFVRLRRVLVSQDKMAKELDQVKSFVLKHSHKTNQEFRRVWRAIEKLSSLPPPQEEHRLGFRLD